MILNTLNIHAVKTTIAMALAISCSGVLFAAKEVTTAYVVKQGDTYASIAKKLGLTEKELKGGIADAWSDGGCLEPDPLSLRTAKILYIKHKDYSEEKKLKRKMELTSDLKSRGVTSELQSQLPDDRLAECEEVLGLKISNEDYLAALCRFDNVFVTLREKTADAKGRNEIYGYFNKADGKPDYAIVFRGKNMSFYRIDEMQGSSKRIVTLLNADKPREAVDMKDFKNAFTCADRALVLTSYLESDTIYLLHKQRYRSDLKIADKVISVGTLYFDASTYWAFRVICPHAIQSYRVNIKFISDEADPVDLGYYYLYANVSRKELIKPMKKGLQEIVDRNWRLDRSSSRPASPPSVTDSEVRYLIDCPGHLEISPQ